ncbi:unnamed protein product [Nesidiocoris tenuis]|uniref:Uncharacterized protein n=1 Tax=Nesidiocoris tenuis TaxID=355587 RepID=A0A6H5GT06_9HEMI|nr:unnamed protein product [Nesidiocoris tenuis]
MATRRFGRPRTKVYDLNYNLGESYYRGALEGLDRKYGRAPAETIEAPKRPTSVGDIESLLRSGSQQNGPAANQPILDVLEEDKEMMDTLRRIQKARRQTSANAEAEFENTFFNRAEQVKNTYSEKMLDSVGLNSNLIELESKRRKERQLQALEDSTPKITEKWIALRDAAQDSVDEAQARARARASKARLADLENEMDALCERTAAREKRLAGLRMAQLKSDNVANCIALLVAIWISASTAEELQGVKKQVLDSFNIPTERLTPKHPDYKVSRDVNLIMK